MSMLPDLISPDECDTVYEEAFFRELHRKAHHERVRTRHYSYPKYMEPIDYEGNREEGSPVAADELLGGPSNFDSTF